ncbi:MAG: hydrogenase [Candidatus Omnitrophica bacterium]|nr:hydrogenase [Candidatus Omnitrophota bacterium]
MIRFAWQVPFGEFSLKLDPLNLIFLLSIAVVTLCAGLYAGSYMRAYRGVRSLAAHAFFFSVLILSLVLVVTANHVLLFLGAWELMAVATYFLIIFHEEKNSVRRSGFLYLIATHCGTFCLLAMFFLMAQAAGSMDFDRIAATAFSPAAASVIFILALLGFGVKAGFFPLHIWLPHAHPAAPSHVSALLSGVAIKIGIYGLCRIIAIVPTLPDWCGYFLLMIGVVSGLMGVLYALGQHELKKFLAYHSVENIGIIALGLGVGLLGRTHQQPFIAALGFAGGLFHVLNHSLFKALLFFSAGAVMRKTGTGAIDQMGGVAKLMPWTSGLFLIGALSICGLPLFNGFVSEFFVYFALFQGLLLFPLKSAAFCAIGILSLALMGCLALACFTKVYGIVFLGEARNPDVVTSTRSPQDRGLDLPAGMFFPMLVLAGLCIWIGLCPWFIARLTWQAGTYLTAVNPAFISGQKIFSALGQVIAVSFGLLGIMTMVLLFQRIGSRIAALPRRETWRCGFSGFTPRLQYTAASFARSILECLKTILVFRKTGSAVLGEFPARVSLASGVHDAAEDFVFRPFYGRLRDLAKGIQKNRLRYTQVYLIYILFFLVFLIVLKFR